MLFNSHVFLFAFLPAVLPVYFLLGRFGNLTIVKLWLVAASLFFYGWWNPPFVALLLGSICFNFAMGNLITHYRNRSPVHIGVSLALTFGIIVNLGVIAYFKYAGLIVEAVNALLGQTFAVGNIFLPLAISFFTFQQIAYLVDTARGEVKEHNFLDLCTFVTFFPHLIAGPLLHHKEVIPQFRDAAASRLDYQRFAAGLSFLVIGLGKKTMIADPLSSTSDMFFDAPADQAITLVESWIAVSAFTLAIYFDFSGYSDMAIGLARMLGIKLPYNFNSPYKATSIIEFWRRWHITLSRFLRDYLYISLGGNRRGTLRRYANLMTTMLLGGLWHGASWTFVLWGALHGTYLLVNHAWVGLQRRALAAGRAPLRLGRGLSWALTFGAVILGWVLFRAPSFEGAMNMMAGLVGANGVVWALPDPLGPEDFIPLLMGFGIALFLPNSQAIIDARAILVRGRGSLALAWRASPVWAGLLAVVAVSALTRLSEVHEFIYFQF